MSVVYIGIAGYKKLHLELAMFKHYLNISLNTQGAGNLENKDYDTGQD